MGRNHSTKLTLPEYILYAFMILIFLISVITKLWNRHLDDLAKTSLSAEYESEEISESYVSDLNYSDEIIIEPTTVLPEESDFVIATELESAEEIVSVECYSHENFSSNAPIEADLAEESSLESENVPAPQNEDCSNIDSALAEQTTSTESLQIAENVDELILPATEIDSESITLININTANQQELMTLKGIGEVKSKAIIDYRTEHGYFSSVDELINVKGIGEKTLEKLRDYITV